MMESKSPVWLNSWAEDALRRERDLRTKWRREREGLDLEIETSPLQSSYSDDLVALMQREEQASAEGDFAMLAEIAQRVDAALASETTKYFMTQADVTCQKLQALFRKQAVEGEQFSAELDTQMAAVCASARVAPIHSMELHEAENELGSAHQDRSMLEAFEAEERRVWRVAQRDMAANERFSLAAAFDLQLRRVDAEWSAHEEQMKCDYLAERAEIEGRQVERVTVSPAVGPWKSKEKQSLLIHTAPVHAPTQDAGLQTQPTKAAGAAAAAAAAENIYNFENAVDQDQVSIASTLSSSSSMDGSSSCSSSSSVNDLGAGGKVEDELFPVRNAAAAQASLHALEKAYATARRRTAFQKENAVRSIKRQSARMFVQVAAMEKGKRLLASRLESEEVTLAAIENRVKVFVSLLVRRGGLPPVLPLNANNNSSTAAGGGRGGGSPANQPALAMNSGTRASSVASGDDLSISSTSSSRSPDRSSLQISRQSSAASRLDPGSPTRVDTRRPSRQREQPPQLQLSLQAEAVTWSTSPAKSLKSPTGSSSSSRTERKATTEGAAGAATNDTVVRIPTPRTPVVLSSGADEAR